MYLKSLKLNNFRNIKTQSIEFSPEINILYGSNGSGKTNILEAVFVLCLGRSHRSSMDTVMIEKGNDFYRLEGLVNFPEKETEVALAFQKGGRKKITIDKVSVRIHELYENFCVVSAGPEDSDILSGSPSSRRTFIDMYLSQKSKNYLNNLTQYQKILTQKNAALKHNMDPSPFNSMLIDFGSSLMVARNDFISLISGLSEEFYNKITSGGSFKTIYNPSISFDPDNTNHSAVKDAFEQTLQNVQEKERIMQSSLKGPHRDDIGFEIENLPARHHGSQGEWRTAAISLKLAVYKILKEEKETIPILLLDEIFAELDNERIQGLVNSFGGFGQLILTTAQEPPDVLKKGSRCFRISNGSIEETV